MIKKPIGISILNKIADCIKREIDVFNKCICKSRKGNVTFI